MPTIKKPSVNHVGQTVMTSIRSNTITMKPRWYFIAGSFFMMAGLVGLSMGAIFLTNLTLFLLRTHGPMGQWKLARMLEEFPLWIPILAVIGITLGLWILKQYDFSYKKNFRLITLGFLASVILAAVLIDHTGINETWSRQGPMRRLYQRIEMQTETLPKTGTGRINKWLR